MNEEIRRGEDAKRLLSEPLLVEAFGKIEAALISRLKIVDVGAMEAQRDLIVSLQLLHKVRNELEQVVLTGELAKQDSERESWGQKLRKRM